MNYLKNFKTVKAAAGTAEASAEMTRTAKDAAAGRAKENRVKGETSIIQKLGALFLFTTAAWSLYVNIDSFGTFLVMFNEMFITHTKVLSGDYLTASFILGFGAVPLFVLGVLLRLGAPGGSALKWGVIGLLTSVLTAIFWLVVIILMSIGVALSPF
ncbi:MAG: hypothetical protein FWE48_02950 [Coriobacteriia bacterium]|nr:hypothetical protein [Coriobacteriia bacterium]MCL2870352.1 hypothetical protein [Coriobacteriia bacterium]